MYCKLKEFCRLTGLTRKSLQLYEEKDLLVPSKVDSDNGYRYYSDKDILKGSKISFLRSLGFGVEEIRMTLSNSNPYELFSRKEFELKELSQRVEHGLQYFNITKSSPHDFNYILSRKLLSPATVLSISGRGSARDIEVHFSVLRKFIKENIVSCRDFSFTYYYEDSSQEKLHFKVCQPVDGFSLGVVNENIVCEYFNPFNIAYITHYGSYEILPQIYQVLKKKLLLSSYNFYEEYVEIYKNFSMFSTVMNSTTFVTDVGAVLC